MIVKTVGSFAVLILTLRSSDECYGIKSEAGAGWRELEKVPRFLYNSAVATLANTAFLIGGFEEEPVDSVLSYTGDTDTWAEATKLRWSYNKAKLQGCVKLLHFVYDAIHKFSLHKRWLCCCHKMHTLLLVVRHQ